MLSSLQRKRLEWTEAHVCQTNPASLFWKPSFWSCSVIPPSYPSPSHTGESHTTSHSKTTVDEYAVYQLEWMSSNLSVLFAVPPKTHHSMDTSSPKTLACSSISIRSTMTRKFLMLNRTLCMAFIC